ncbi:MAG: substrate-binding domain-containing protein [Eubacterium sp.]|nr:substrate-binding domain-containing protein [Eubacterium sp.]
MKKKLVAALMSATMVASLMAGCGGSSDSASSAASTAASAASEAAEDTAEAATELVVNPDDMLAGTQFEGLEAKEAYNFQIIVKAFQNTYWQAVMAGANKAAEELGVTIDAQGPNNESDIADQVNMLNSAINNKPDGIGLSACDASSVIDSLKQAQAAGVPVVCFDTAVGGAPEGSVVSTIATDSIAAGGVAGKEMWDAIKGRVGEGQAIVGMVAQDATSTNHQQRGQGFIDGLIEAAKADGITVGVTGNDWFVNNCSDKGDASTAQLVIQCAVPAQSTLDLAATEAAAIMNQENCVGMFSSGQTACEGVIQANDNLGILGSDPTKDCILVGFDSGTITKEKIMDGTVYGAITQMPFAMGYYAVAGLVQAANGDPVEDMPIPGYFYNAENMEDELIAPNLYD